MSDTLEFISDWGYGYSFGTAIDCLVNKKYQEALHFMKNGKKHGEIGFKGVGIVSVQSFVERLNVPAEIKEIIAALHRGIHMKRKYMINDAITSLEDFLATANLTPGDGKKVKDRSSARNSEQTATRTPAE